jgi:hypothetical protein
MNDVIDEINGALQLEEGLKAEEGALKIEFLSVLHNQKHLPHLELFWIMSSSGKEHSTIYPILNVWI